MLQGFVKLVAEAIAGIAGSGPERAAALNHELRNHAMKNEAVVKRALHFFPCFRIREFLGAFGEADKIRDGLRGFLFKQPDDDRSLRSIEHGVRAWCAAQVHLLWECKCGSHYYPFRAARPALVNLVLEVRPLGRTSNEKKLAF